MTPLPSTSSKQKKRRHAVIPAMSIPHVEADQHEGDEYSDRRDCAHRYEQGQRDGPQEFLHDRAILGHLAADPALHVAPGEVVHLRVVVAELHVLAVDHLLDLGQGDPVALRAEGDVALHSRATRIDTVNASLASAKCAYIEGIEDVACYGR